MPAKGRYKKSMCKIVEDMAGQAYTHKDIYSALGITYNTFYRWLKEKSEFNDALERGEEKSLKLVVEALKKRALGFEYDEVTVEQRVNAKGEKKPQAIKKTTKFVAPDVGAIAFYLKNRDPDNWKDRREQRNVDGEGNDIKPIQVVLAVKKAADTPDAFREEDFE